MFDQYSYKRIKAEKIELGNMEKTDNLITSKKNIQYTLSKNNLAVRKKILLVSHSLSYTGAPKLLLTMSKVLLSLLTRNLCNHQSGSNNYQTGSSRTSMIMCTCVYLQVCVAVFFLLSSLRKLQRFFCVGEFVLSRFACLRWLLSFLTNLLFSFFPLQRCLKFPGVSLISASFHQDPSTDMQHC